MSKPTINDGAAGSVMLPQFYREAAVVEASFDADKRTFDIVWTAGAEVPRMDWWTGQRYIEVLEVSDKAIRLDRLKSGRAPVLDTHMRWSLKDVVGVVEGNSIRLENGVGHARIRMSESEDAKETLLKLREKTLGNVSPGYITHSYREEMRDGIMYRVATDWEPIEISLVPVGADPDAGLRAAGGVYPCRVMRAVAAPSIDVGAAARMRMRQKLISAA